MAGSGIAWRRSNGWGRKTRPALGPDRRQRVRERHAARDLLGEEEPDHLALVVCLDLLARDDDEVAALRLLDGFERAAEHVVVGDRDRAEPLRLRVVEQLVHRHRAVVRPVRVHVQVAQDPVAVGEGGLGGARAAPAGEAAVERVELRRDLGVARDRAVGCASSHVRAAGLRLQPEAGTAVRRGDQLARGPEHGRAGGRVERGADVHALAQTPRDRRPARPRPGAQHGQLEAGQVVQRADRSAGRRPLGRIPLHDDPLLFAAGLEQVRGDSARNDAEIAGKPQARRLGRLGRRREQRVRAREQPVALSSRRAGRRGARARRTSPRRARRSPAAPGRRGSAGPARTRGRRRSCRRTAPA